MGPVSREAILGAGPASAGQFQVLAKYLNSQNNQRVDPSQKNFLILNGVVVTLVVVAILASRRGKKGPVKLSLGGSASQGQNPSKEVGKGAKALPRPKDPRSEGPSQKRPPGWDNYRPRSRPEPTEPIAPREINLNVLFNWNGHTWDAYEVLGLPAGSSREAAAAAYNALCAKSDPESLPFLKAAFEAILKG